MVISAVWPVLICSMTALMAQIAATISLSVFLVKTQVYIPLNCFELFGANLPKNNNGYGFLKELVNTN